MFSLKHKIILYNIVAILFVVSIFSLASFGVINQFYGDTIRTHTREDMVRIGLLAEKYLATNNVLKLNEFISEEKNSNPLALFIVIYDYNENVVASTFASHADDTLLHVSKKSLDIVSGYWIDDEGKEVLVIEEPLISDANKVGTLKMGFDLSRFKTFAVDDEHRILFIALLSILFMFLIEYVIATYLLRPIMKLNRFVKDVSKNTAKEFNPVSSHDEIEEITHSFESLRKDFDRCTLSLTESTITEAHAQEAIEENKKEMGRSQEAILNLLEDLQFEKVKVDEIVILRTQELNEEKARLLASLDSLPFGFIVADSTFNILIKNPALSAILEVHSEFQTLETLTTMTAGIDFVALSKECVSSRASVARKEVSYAKKYINITCVPVFDGQVMIGNIILVEDITEAKVLERSRDEFFAVASHELRTPLTAIRGNTEMIRDMFADKINDPDVESMLSDIEASSIRLIEIVNDFLEVSRLEQGKIEMKNELFDFSDVVDKVMRDLGGVASDKGLSLVYHPSHQPTPRVFADKNRVEQVLVNLIGNAMKFTTKGSITITIESDVEVLNVRVTDTGDGISPHNQTLLFRKFQQAGEKMLARNATQSSGLGLYISRLLMTNMNGTVRLEKSELGVGSTFIMTIPLARG